MILFSKLSPLLSFLPSLLSILKWFTKSKFGLKSKFHLLSIVVAIFLMVMIHCTMCVVVYTRKMANKAINLASAHE